VSNSLIPVDVLHVHHQAMQQPRVAAGDLDVAVARIGQ
jgi:hypothetical protein